MLRELKVESFALIERLSVRFEPGFNVLTGETGAGKSLLVDALGLAIGGRASAELVRAGAKEAVVEAMFEARDEAARESLDAALRDKGLPGTDGVMVVRRLVDAKGRHRVYINGSLATVATLSELCSGLVTLSGQHEHVSLTRPGEALTLLDDFASAKEPEFEDAQSRYDRAWSALSLAREKHEKLDRDPDARVEREAFLRFQLSELEALSPRPTEIEELEAERRLLTGADQLRAGTSEAEALLYSDDDAASAILARLARRLEGCAKLDPALGPHIESIESAMALVAEAGRELGEYSRRVDADPARMEKVEGRLAALRRLARRHGGDLAAACESAERLRAELEEIERYDSLLEEASRALREAEDGAELAARRLSEKRGQAALQLDEAVRESLARLGMRGSRVSLRVRDGQLGPRGGDRVEVGLASDSASPLRSISKVASGGELSRLLLAFRRAIAGVDGVASAVFDEVDAGVGGAVAEAVGLLMAEIATGRQVLCVTHLPQIAVHAGHQVVVKKSIRDDRAHIEAVSVSGQARVEEISRMLGGANLTASTRKHAKELLELAAAARSLDGGGDPRQATRDGFEQLRIRPPEC